ncbi:MAG: hypothetical protein ACPIOQ_60530, partial [Promethearchaeia archaeon]
MRGLEQAAASREVLRLCGRQAADGVLQLEGGHAMKIVQALRVHEAHTTAPDKMQVLPVAF